MVFETTGHLAFIYGKDFFYLFMEKAGFYYMSSSTLMKQTDPGELCNQSFQIFLDSLIQVKL